MFNRLKYFIIDLVFVLGIILLIYFFVDFKFGQYLFTGDFRFHIDRTLIGDQFLHLVSRRFSNNNFVFLPFYPLYFFLQFIPYHYTLVYIFFVIPILLFLSTKYVLLKLSNFSYNNIPLYLFIAVLAFYFAINPSLFDRFGHWPILHGAVFFPLYAYCLGRYLGGNLVFNKYLWLQFLFLFLGAVTPHLVVVYFAATVVLYSFSLFANKKNFKLWIRQGTLIFLGSIVVFAHILFPLLIGQGQTKSFLESATTPDVFSSLARNSNIISAISGTNYYYQLIKFPCQPSVGFLIFLSTLLAFCTANKKGKKDTFLLLISLILLVVITGYVSFKSLFDFLNQTFLSQLIWLVKDPNMYYLFFLFPLLLLLTRLVSTLKMPIKKFSLAILAFLLLALNVIFIFSSDRKAFNKFYDFVNVPEDYFILAEELKNDEGRNLWLPANVYVSKNFSNQISYFPSPSFWLTKNKELTRSTPEYIKLIDFFEDEVYEKDCRNIYLLNWLIAAQQVNVIIDRNSVNNLLLNDYSIETKIEKAQACLKRLPNINKVKTIGNIDIYKSNLRLQDTLYLFKGPLDSLNGFLALNPVNVIYQEVETSEIETIHKNFTVLTESFDENWLDLNENSARAKVNFSSMLFDEDQEFHYRGEKGFERITAVQKITLSLFLLLAISEIFKKYESK